MKFSQIPTIGHPYVEDSIGAMLSSIENDLCELRGKIDTFHQTVQFLLSDKYKKHRSVIADKRRLLRKYAKLVK